MRFNLPFCFRFQPVMAAVLLVLAVSVTPALAGVKIQHWVAPSGARVYFVESRVVPILDVQVDFMAGGLAETADKVGVAGLTQKLIDTGAGEFDEETISQRRVDVGAHFGGGADADRASVSVRTLSSRPERDVALDLFRLVLSSPSYPQAALEREKARTIAALREADTRPEAIAQKRFAAAMYPGHPYGYSATVESVSAITRQDLVDFHRRHYRAKSAVVSIIGSVSRAEAEEIAQRLTESLPVSAPEEPAAVAATLPAVSLPSAGVVRVEHPATQAHVHVGLPTIARKDPDYFPLLVGNYTLGGGGFVSRLMKEVREKRGYAYSVYSYVAPRRLAGPFEIGLQTKRDQADAALKVVNEVLADYVRRGPTDIELRAAKKNLVDGLALRIDSNAKLLGYLSTIGFYDLPLTYLDEFPARVNAVTSAQVRAAFAKHVRFEHLVTVLVAADKAH